AIVTQLLLLPVVYTLIGPSRQLLAGIVAGVYVAGTFLLLISEPAMEWAVALDEAARGEGYGVSPGARARTRRGRRRRAGRSSTRPPARHGATCRPRWTGRSSAAPATAAARTPARRRWRPARPAGPCRARGRGGTGGRTGPPGRCRARRATSRSCGTRSRSRRPRRRPPPRGRRPRRPGRTRPRAAAPR